MAPTFDQLRRSRYLLLTTFTKDGRPKPTVIWVAPDGDALLVITDHDSWKVRRIRNTPRVTLAAGGCTATDGGGEPRRRPARWP